MSLSRSDLTSFNLDSSQPVNSNTSTNVIHLAETLGQNAMESTVTNDVQTESGQNSTSIPAQKENHPGDQEYDSPYTSSLSPLTASSGSGKSTSTTEKLAEISERVNQILAPVHALGTLQKTTPPIASLATTSTIATQPITPTPASPIQTTNPPRNGGRRARGLRRRGSPLASDTITVFSASASGFTTPPASRGRGSGRARGTSRSSRGSTKRKRSSRSLEGENEPEYSDTDSSENFTPLAQSRSGRKIIQASTNSSGTPVIKLDPETSAKPSPTRPPSSAKASPTTLPTTARMKSTPSSSSKASMLKKRPSFKRTPGGAGAVCKNCSRGHSPTSNAIVFCDGCNTPWHQFCHNPPIGQDIVMIAEKEWFCSDCIVLREEKSRLQGKVSGAQMSLLEVCLLTFHSVFLVFFFPIYLTF
jgi:hypothetical protein